MSPDAHSARAELLGVCTASMLRIRRIEEEIERRYHQDQMKTPIHLVIGQEATAVGCCAALPTTDLVYSSHRTHGDYLAKGGDLKAMLCEMHCRINGCVGSRGGSMHLIDKRVGMAGTSAIVGGAVPIATGAALAAQMKGEDRVVVVFLGDATTEEGVTSESLNFAALKQAAGRVLLREQLLLGAVAAGDAAAARATSARWAAAHGMPAVAVDGVNVLAVHDAVSAAVERARAGGGPTFIEAPVYRFRAHGGSGDDSRTGYRARGRTRRVGGRRSARAVRRVPDAVRSCSTTRSSRRWKRRLPRKSPRPSSSRSPARTRPRKICTTCVCR